MHILAKALTIINRFNPILLIFILVFLYRLPNITSFVNDDDSLWKYRGYVFGTALTSGDLAKTAVTYHPGVPLMWSQMLSIKVFGIVDDFLYHGVLQGADLFWVNHLIQNLFLLFFNSILITLIFYLLLKIIKLKKSIIFMFLLIFEPFFISLARSIHNDLLVSLFCYLSFLSFFIVSKRLQKTTSYKSILTSKMMIATGLFMALGLLTKSSALFILPMLISVTLSFIFVNPKLFKKYLASLSIALLFMILFFVLIWPAMWVNPGGTLWLYFYKGIFDTAIEEGHRHYWFGQLTMDPGFWFYPIVVLGRYQPWMIFGLIAGFIWGVKYLIKYLKTKKLTEAELFIFLNLVFFVGYFVLISITSKKLDRYTLPLLFPMAMFTTYLVYGFISRFKKIAYWILGFVFAVDLAFLTWIHPNYLVYYSPFIGGPYYGMQIIEPKWVIGFDQVANYLNEQNKLSTKKLNVVTPDAHILSYFAYFEPIYPDNPEARKGDYFVIPTFKAYSATEMIKQFDLQNIAMPVKNINIAGVTYYTIYKKLK